MRKKLSCLLAVIFLVAGAAFGQGSAADDLKTAKQAYAGKDYETASRYYQAAILEDPQSAAAYQGLGNCYYYLGRNSEALAAYQKALDLNPNNAPLASFVNKMQGQKLQPAASISASATLASPGLPADAGHPSAAASPGLPADAALANTASPGLPAAAAMVNLAGPGLPSEAAPKTFELDFMGGAAITVPEHYVGQTSTGFGGEMDGLFLVTPQIGVGAGLSYQNIPSRGDNVEITYLEYEKTTLTSGYLNILAVGKFRLGGQRANPYFRLGAGMCFLTSSGTITLTNSGTVLSSNSYSTTSSYPLVEGGLGVEFPLGSGGMNLFFQSAYDLIFSSNGTAFFVPIDGGLNVLF